MPLPIWQVDLYVEGAISMRQRWNGQQQKGFRIEDPFYSDIEIQTIPAGLRATVTARAVDQELAYKAALFFFGKVLDALTFAIKLPLIVSLEDRDRPRGRTHDVRRIIEAEELEAAFDEAHHLATGSPSFLRSLGWYRKALSANDPFDRFLSFWNAMEIVAAKYFRYVPGIDHERAKKSKGQLWECFKALWGDCEQWPNIPGQKEWIDQNYETRIEVAHGNYLCGHS